MDLFRTTVSRLINYQPVRNRNWTNVRPIMGWPRPHLYKKGKPYPEPYKYHFRPYLPEDGSYTAKPLPIFKMGGRDLETGRVVVRTRGGGNKKNFRWAQTTYQALEDGSPRQEQVLLIKYSPLHSPKLALVADEERTRWILAPEGAQVGDIITTYSDIPRNPIKPKLGDAHPVGALPVGTHIHQIETKPGNGAQWCVHAGTCAEITKRESDGVTIKLPNNNILKVDPNCMAVVGQLSNVGCENVRLMCPQRLRWLGFRPRSGQWRRKDGWCGKRAHPTKFYDVTMAALKAKIENQKNKYDYDITI